MSKTSLFYSTFLRAARLGTSLLGWVACACKPLGLQIPPRETGWFPDPIPVRIQVGVRHINIPQLGVVEDIRTLYAENDPHLLKVLHNIRKLEDKFSRSDPEPTSEVCHWRKPRRHHMEPTIEQLREAMNRPRPSDDTPLKLAA